VGRTTLVKTLALTVPKDLKVLILDLNFQDGGSDLSYMLNLEAIPHVGMYLKSRTREAFEECLVEFRPNIYIMQAPPRLTLVESITPEDVKQMIEYGRALFDFIIIDLPNENNALVRAALEASNKVLLLTNATTGEINRIRENCSHYDYTLVVVNPVSRMWRTFTDLLSAPVIEVKDLDAQAEEILGEVV
jgi:MinD-like ATPase involved in chromosome partitioning or flagellar assembly